GANGVVAGGIPIAVGAAQGLKMQKSDAIVACMFGDGAVNRGPFLEGLNWAVLYKLPVLFVCEDNGVAAFTRADSVTAGPGVIEVTLVEASRRAALQEMRRDPRVWVLGEDVARGGLWGQYKDFSAEFGAERVVSTPISEATIMGAGLGSALVGMRPIIEMRIF